MGMRLHLHTMTDLAKKVGQPVSNICWAANCGLIPAPDILIERRRYYSGTQFRAVLPYFKKNTGEYTVTRLRVMFNLTLAKITGWRKHGLFPEPCAIRGKREVWNEKQIKQIRRLLPKLKNQPSKREPDGFYTAARAAKVLGMPKITIQSWIYGGKIPGPTHTVPGWSWKFYDDADLANIRKIKSGYFAARI